MGLAASPQRPDLFLVAEVSDPCQAWVLRGQWAKGLGGSPSPSRLLSGSPSSDVT